MNNIKLDETKLKVLKCKDKNDSLGYKINRLFDLPCRLLLCGATGTGKSNFLVNFFLNENYKYKDIIKGGDCYIFAPAPYADNKMRLIIEEKSIPESNIFEDFSNELLLMLYDNLVEEYEESIALKKTPTQKIIVLDDLSFSSKFSDRFNALAKVFQNGRKFLISCICLTQYYNQTTPAIRLNSSALVLWRTPNSMLEQIEKEHNFLIGGKKAFFKMIHENVKTKQDFVVINYSNDSNEIYLNKHMENITPQENGNIIGDDLKYNIKTT
tara:strand:- start:609 stop:1415 length:807 start_codon:yes stop_codon:yes gene_type:complete